MEVKVKKLNDLAVIPSYAKPGDAGLDLTTTGAAISADRKQVTYHTGLSFEIPAGHVGLIFPRSSICKKDLSLSNAVGVIDSQYRGEVKAVFNLSETPYGTKPEIYAVGDRIAQMIIMPYPEVKLKEVSELGTTERGVGGFGSSDTKKVTTKSEE